MNVTSHVSSIFYNRGAAW